MSASDTTRPTSRVQFVQETGVVLLDGIVICKPPMSYSGHGAGLNNPAMQAVHAVGPIPLGLYEMSEPFDSLKTGHYVVRLDPIGHDALGRADLEWHGDEIGRVGDMLASDGCIISPRVVRKMVFRVGTVDVI